jgi:signal peptidase I
MLTGMQLTRQWQINMYSHDQSRFYRGESMLGTFQPGDYLTVIPVRFDEINIGDVVVFRGPSSEKDEKSEWVHRVVLSRPGGLVTRGDNNSYNDLEILTNDNIIGKVTHASRDGKTRLIMGGRWGFLKARCLHTRHPLTNLFRRFCGRYYRWLKASRLISCLWKPDLHRLSLKTDDGLLVKYLNNGRTVARWWPETKKFDVVKPFDLVIPYPKDSQ